MTHEVGVVYVNYDSAELINKSIHSLDHPHRLIVVDNFHSDRAREQIEAVLPAGALLLAQKNLGFAAGINAANEELGPNSTMLIVNPDAYFATGSMSRLVANAEHAEAHVVSPRILDAHTHSVWFDGGRVSAHTGEVSHFSYGKSPTVASGLQRTSFVSGCALLLSPRARKAVLPLREDLFMYYEDAELSHRAITSGLSLWVDTNSIVFHDEGSTSRTKMQTRSPLFYYYQGRNRLLAELEASRLSRVTLTPWVATRTVARILRRERPKLQLLGSYLAGTLTGIREALREQ